MTALTARELDAPYQYVVAEQAVSDVARLLEAEAEDELVVSDWYRRVRRGPRRSILELKGLGKEVWEGVDPKTYIDEMRNEWDHR